VEESMRDDLLRAQWRKFRILIQDMWMDLTDDDLARIQGNWDPLVDRIEEISGDLRSDIEARIEALIEIFSPDSPPVRRTSLPEAPCEVIPRITLAIAVFLIGIGAAGCGSDNSSAPGFGTMNVRMTDAPGDFEHVNLVVVEVSARMEAALRLSRTPWNPRTPKVGSRSRARRRPTI
jgi:hypothetical protein